MATLTPQSISLAGLTPAYSAAGASGDVFQNTGDQYVEVVNAGVSSTTVTVTTPATVGGLAIADATATVGAGTRKKLGPFPPAIFNDANGQVSVACSPTTDVTIGVFKL